MRFLLGCVGFRAAGATLGLHLWLPKTQQYLQARNVGFFPPSSSPENRKCLSPWGCFCSRTINSIHGPPQLALTAACSCNQKCASWVFQTGSRGVGEFIQELHWFRMSPPNVVSQRPSCLSQCWLLYPL